MSVLAPPPQQDELEALIREARARQRRRRILAAVAVVIAAGSGLSVYGVLSDRNATARRTGGPRRLPVLTLPRCQSDQLRLSAPKMWGAAAGSLIEQLTLTNTSHTSCAVAGWPAVRRLNRSGQVIPIQLQREVYEQRAAAPFRVVGLRPDGAATFPVTGQDWNTALDRSCRNAQTIEVEPRGGGGWLSVTLKNALPACPLWLVGPFVPGHLAPWPPLGLSAFYAVHGRTFSGHEDGVEWRLTAQDSGDGRYCFRVVTDGVLRGTKCGRFSGPRVPGKLGWISDSMGARSSFVAGAVTSRAQVIAVHLSRGYPRFLQTMWPTRHLAPGISFFFTTIPRAARPISIIGRTHASRLVVAWHRP